MLAIIESLLVVQNRDQAIERLRKTVQQIPEDAKKAKACLFLEKDAWEARQKQVSEKQLVIKSLELDIATRRDTIAKLKTQQFETKKNEEYTALGNEVERYTTNVDELETQQLVHMEELEFLQSKEAAAADQFEKQRALVQKNLNAMKAKKAESESRLIDLEAERVKLMTPIDSATASIYERLVKSKGADAIVPVQNGVCGGCHIKLVANTMISVAKEEEITYCENCGRMLYHP